MPLGGRGHGLFTSQRHSGQLCEARGATRDSRRTYLQLENFGRQLKARANESASLRGRASRFSCTCHVRRHDSLVPSLVVCQDCGGTPWLLRWGGLPWETPSCHEKWAGSRGQPQSTGGGDAKTDMYQNDHAQLLHIYASPDLERAQHLVSP